MGGQDGIRGYFYQTLVGLLDALNGNNEWTTFTLEPDDAAEKVDIVWSYGDRTKAVQVKSRTSKITVKEAKSWANDLKNSVVADAYELVLIGPHSRALDQANSFDGVDLPPAKQLSIIDMVQQAAHKLDHYLDSRNVARTPPQIRELIVGGLVSLLTTWSTEGMPISREDFDYQLREWILKVYPESVVEASKMGCTVLANNVLFWHTQGRLFLGLKTEFVNIGKSIVIIDSVVMTVTTQSQRIAYRAAYSEKELFPGFFLPIDGSLKTTLWFMCLDADYDGLWLQPNHYELNVFLKYRDRDVWSDVHSLQFEIESDFIDDIASGCSNFVQAHPDASCITV